MQTGPAIYKGTVSHARLRPRPHKLAYSVFALWLDLDDLEGLSNRSRWFSYNRNNLISFHDVDHGRGTGARLCEELANDLASHPDLADVQIARIRVLCYPRVLGYVFNPLTVFFAYDEADRIRAMIYQVSNTFHERRSYIIPVDDAQADQIFQACAKELYVSPFLPIAGGYTFNIRPPAETTCIGVNYRDTHGPMLKAFFVGERRPFTDAHLLWTALRIPFLTMKVTAAIHYEAAKLWLKRIALVKRDRTGAFAISNIPTSTSRKPQKALPDA